MAILRVILVALLAAAVPAAAWVAATVPTAQPPADDPQVRPILPISVAGCSAAACHGMPSPKSLTAAPDAKCWEGSATHWIAADPHTRAFAALKTPLAADMMKRMHGDDRPAAEDVRCLACHTDPGSTSSAMRDDGIRCTTCHGEFGGDVFKHTTFRNDPRDEAYSRTGMTKLYDLGVRAEVCAGCHVGAPAKDGIPLRDMNHDMIAAGHPRLNFELASYQQKMRPHWFEKERDKSNPSTVPGPAREVRTWLMGRWAQSLAAVELLADRAARPDTWPELAEYNCFACHHELEPESWRQKRPQPRSGRKPGTTPWQTIWPATMTNFNDRSDSWPAVGNLIIAMERARVPNTATVKSLAGGIAERLRRHDGANILQLSDERVVNVSRDLLGYVRQEQIDHLDWDEAVQMYHGIAALDRARGKTPDARVAALGERLRSARMSGSRTFDSPRGWTPQTGRAALRECLDSLPTWADLQKR